MSRSESQSSWPTRRILLVLGGLICACALAVYLYMPEALELLTQREQTQLIDEDGGLPKAQDDAPRMLLIALDGVDRALLYDMLGHGELPALERLLGGRNGEHWAHAYLSEKLLASMPTSTLPAWATIFTGKTPSEHGVTGNEFFVREQRRLAAPAPVSFSDPNPVLATYTDGYANQLLEVQTLYERLRARDPSLTVWVSMSQYFVGANRLLTADRSVIADAFQALLSGTLTQEHFKLYAKLDEEVVDTLTDALAHERAPHLITLYLTGTDNFAHVHAGGPDEARRKYLREAVDPQLAKLQRALERQSGSEHRYIMLVSDHGHTQVIHDAAHALSTDEDSDPPAILESAGFRLRPFELEVADDDDFQAVLAYGGALAYVYLADRSACQAEASVCNWEKPPRFEQDVVPAAEAFFRANASGSRFPGFVGSLDMILTREPRPYSEPDLPFQVYVGAGKLVPIAQYLADHPRPQYIDFEARMRDLAAGRYGERAGDVLLIANNGNAEALADRRYFAGLYHSWHGSPSRQDSQVPLIVAHPKRTAKELESQTDKVLGPRPRQQHLARLIEQLLQAP